MNTPIGKTAASTKTAMNGASRIYSRSAGDAAPPPPRPLRRRDACDLCSARRRRRITRIRVRLRASRARTERPCHGLGRSPQASAFVCRSPAPSPQPEAPNEKHHEPLTRRHTLRHSHAAPAAGLRCRSDFDPRARHRRQHRGLHGCQRRAAAAAAVPRAGASGAAVSRPQWTPVDDLLAAEFHRHHYAKRRVLRRHGGDAVHGECDRQRRTGTGRWRQCDALFLQRNRSLSPARPRADRCRRRQRRASW